MAFNSLNKLFRPWLSNCDQTTQMVNYSINSIYKCLDVTSNQCLPSIVYNSEQLMNFCGPILNSKQCLSELSSFESMANNIQFNYNLMNIFMRSRTRVSAQEHNNPESSSSLPTDANSSTDGNITANNNSKIWYTRKLKRQRPKRFTCPHCQIGFSNNGQLKGHIRTHTGERPFVCDHPNCGKSFTRNEELTRHRRIHTGIRPYCCNVCTKRFGRKDHLKKHQRTHEKRFYSLPSLDLVPQSSSSSFCSSTNSMSSFYNSMYFQIRHQF